jgi:hypothetical protein
MPRVTIMRFLCTSSPQLTSPHLCTNLLVPRARISTASVMALADDFDSSDIEVDPPPPDKYSRAGARSVNAIFTQASTLRIESKKAVKQLQSVSGAPTTRMHRARWGNAWNAFYSGVLKKR